MGKQTVVGTWAEIVNGNEIDHPVTCCRDAKTKYNALLNFEDAMRHIFNHMNMNPGNYTMIFPRVEYIYCPICGTEYPKGKE